jgi:hypothetical protein
VRAARLTRARAARQDEAQRRAVPGVFNPRAKTDTVTCDDQVGDIT